MHNKVLFHTKHCNNIKSNLINCGFNLEPRSLQQLYRRERHVTSVRDQDYNLDLSSAHAFTTKFPVLGRIVPQGQHGAFRNKYIVCVLHTAVTQRHSMFYIVHTVTYSPPLTPFIGIINELIYSLILIT